MIPAERKLPSIEYLHECFEYDDHLGALIWRSRPLSHFKNTHGQRIFNSKHAGRAAGGVSHHEYSSVCLYGRKIYTHRIIWAMDKGSWPAGEIDHIDHDPGNNHIINLRVVNSSGNKKNASRRKDNTTGITNVYKCRDKWRAQIYIDGIHKHLGVFPTAEAAYQSVLSARQESGFHQNHGASA